MTKTELFEEANAVYRENYLGNKERFKTEIRIHYNKVLDYFEVVDALFFDGKLVGSKPISDKFLSKEEVFEYVRNMYHAARRNMLLTFNPEPEESQSLVVPAP